jgi:hypothetical protein
LDFFDLTDAVERIYRHATSEPKQGSGGDHELWPLRIGADSGLGGNRACGVFSEFVETFAGNLVAGFPANLQAPPPNGSGASCFTHEAIERHTAFFAESEQRRQARDVSKRPYDEMRAAFPSITRLVTPMLLGKALRDPAITLDALEFDILHSKRPTTLSHAHEGAANCGRTLNVLALIAHLRVAGEHRCAVIATKPLPASVSLVPSIHAAIRSLLADVHTAASLLDDSAVMRTLIESPVVAGVLAAGGPLGRGPRNATNVEIAPGQTLPILQAIYRADDRPSWPHLALAVPLHSGGDGPKRIARSTLEPEGRGWPANREKFVRAVAATKPSARANSPRELDGPPPAEWWWVPARLKAAGVSQPVKLMTRRVGGGRSTTVWTTLLGPPEVSARGIETLMSSRLHASSQSRSTPLPGSPYGLWIGRAYRQRAAGGLLLKGGSGDHLREGVTAAMNAGFFVFVVNARVKR